MSLPKIDEARFEEEVLRSDRPAILDFGAEWCGPCKKLHPIMEELAGELGSAGKFLYVDVAETPRIARNYDVISVPQVLIFRGGKVVDRVVGLAPKAGLKAKIEAQLKG